jgi:hypothetical protein
MVFMIGKDEKTRFLYLLIAMLGILRMLGENHDFFFTCSLQLL